MEIKVKYQGQVVGLIDFKVFTVIEKMRELGYGSFIVRSEVSQYDYFAKFLNEETEDYISFYTEKSFMKRNDYKVKYEELKTIIEIFNYYIYIKDVEESD